MKEYKSRIQTPNHKPSSKSGTGDETMLKKTAIERIQKHTEPDETLQIFTGTKHDPPILRQTPETTTDTSSEEEEDQTPIQTQLNKLKRKQHLLRKYLLKRLKIQHLE
uniref:ORF3 n=1 Tax=Chimpanzee anellovirus TaxID=1743410 RepID=A0A0S2GMF2_9VIRU|nr:ORF3 [Chimpanzee anellovirus]